MRYREVTSNSLKSMSLFQYFEANWEDDLSDMTLDVQVSSKFEYVINKLEANFTQFELKQFTNIRSTYAKEMFKKLKQWRTVGKKEYSIEEFRGMLQVPKSYGAKEINTRVLAPIRAELPEYFVGLKVKPIKAKKRGAPIIAYEFTWKPEKAGTWVDSKYEKKKRRDVTAKKPTRRESLPEWAKDDYVAPREKRLSREEQQQFRKRLEKIRKNSSKEVD
ncbi:replication initiation protein, partial [Atopococcus tabaci]|uniref:replication initiation protein n=1 Tax=Atopococcus tabaci TaxID=269774 RepID=UPI0003FB121B